MRPTKKLLNLRKRQGVENISIKLMLTIPPLFREGIRKILKSEEGIEITAEATSQLEIIPLIEENKPDVLFIDTAISNLDIQEILELINQKSAKTKVLLLIHTLDEEVFINAVALGVQGYLTEGSDTEQFIEAIRAVGKEEIWVERRIVTKVLTQLLPLRRDKK